MASSHWCLPYNQLPMMRRHRTSTMPAFSTSTRNPTPFSSHSSLGMEEARVPIRLRSRWQAAHAAIVWQNLGRVGWARRSVKAISVNETRADFGVSIVE
eukprot:875846-Prymnesium_polylepis.1